MAVADSTSQTSSTLVPVRDAKGNIVGYTQEQTTTAPEASTAPTPTTPPATPTTPTPTATEPKISMLDVLVSMFASYGMQDLATQVAGLIANPDLTDAQRSVEVYKLPAYQARFPAMAELQKRGEAISEAEYMRQEKSYKDVLRANALPESFYDSPADFSKWMLGAVSPAEVDRRVKQASRIIETADPTLVNAARDYYGLDRSSLLAYVLDAEKAQPIIDKQMRAIEAGAAANRYAFQMNRAAAEALVSDPMVETLDPVSLRQRFSQARDLADQDKRLSALERTSYNQGDAVDAVLRDDKVKQTASQRRAEREAARFGGSSGFGSQSLTTR